jgi:peptidoglycan/xylan/chitin deacetylase (PgdA/CDA1 family)
MRADQILYLMYHELETPGRPVCRRDPGYLRYVLIEENFSAQVDWLQKENIRGLSVSQALQRDTSRGIVLTFDDGCESDLRVAIPILKKAGFNATFYITLAFLGQPGYLVPQQVREIADAGFDVGCHSMTHPFLNDLDEAGLRHEIAEAKMKLEDILGRPVNHFSCPGGCWSSQVARIARESGYQSVSTSRIAANGPDSDLFRLARVAVMRDTTLAAYQALCRGESLRRLQMQAAVRETFRRVLGNAMYDRLRKGALRDFPKAP